MEGKSVGRLQTSTEMEKKMIDTRIGRIAVYHRQADAALMPVVFLHGVYFDHHLWDGIIDAMEDRPLVALDMPWHGASREIAKENWTLSDCADMLLEILDSLQIPRVMAVGHSWGSMTLLRAASKQPERFASLGLCNMPFLAATKKQKATFVLQHTMLLFRDFYTRQAGKALFGKTTLKENPWLMEELRRPMNLLTNRQLRQTDRAVIMRAGDATDLIKNLKVRAIALKGAEDYVPVPPAIETMVVKGGHISPLEDPGAVLNLIRRLGL